MEARSEKLLAYIDPELLLAPVPEVKSQHLKVSFRTTRLTLRHDRSQTR